jgi:hypothetical protein
MDRAKGKLVVSTPAEMIAKLEAAMARGVRTIESDGERITYSSVDEMLAVIGYFRAQDPAAASGGRVGSTLAVFERD